MYWFVMIRNNQARKWCPLRNRQSCDRPRRSVSWTRSSASGRAAGHAQRCAYNCGGVLHRLLSEFSPICHGVDPIRSIPTPPSPRQVSRYHPLGDGQTVTTPRGGLR